MKIMKRIGLSILLVVCTFMASVAQEGFKITGRLGGTLEGNLVLAASGSEGLVKLDEAVMVNGDFEFACTHLRE